MSTATAIKKQAGAMFRIASELFALLDSYDPETGELPEDFDQQLDALALSSDEKFDGCILALRELAMLKQLQKDEAKRRQARAAVLETREKQIKKAMGFLLSVLNERKIETAYSTVWKQKNPSKLVIDDESAIPGKFVEIVQTTRIDKEAIKAAIKSGDVVPGCHIEQGEGVRFK